MEHSKKILEMLNACFVSQKTYGQNPDRIGELVKTFNFILSDYDIDEIRKAFIQHLKYEADFPTPADIIKILDADKVLDKSLYIKATKWLESNKNCPYTTQEHEYREYVKKYENKMMVGAGIREPEKELTKIEDCKASDIINNLSQSKRLIN